MESTDLRGLAKDLRRAQRAAAKDRQQGQRQHGGSGSDLGSEIVDLDRETAKMVDETAREVRHQPGEVRHMHPNLDRSTGPIHFRRLYHPGSSSCTCPCNRAMMRVRSPTRSSRVIDEEPDFAFTTVESGDRKIRLAQSCCPI
ncbi:hypothetical protein LQL77_30630 [Rhodococcus cerastii]|nr:hypothetical protein [Rhodococcus cerastii]